MICDEDPLRRRPRESTARRKRQERCVWMARKMTEWPSKRGPITKIMPSDGCIGDTVPLAVGKWSLGGGKVVRFPRIWMVYGECRIKERTIHRSRNRAPRMTERNEAPETRILEQIQGLMGEILRKSSEGEGSCLYRGEPECYPIVSSGLYRKCPDCKNEAFDIERIQQEIIENA